MMKKLINVGSFVFSPTAQNISEQSSPSVSQIQGSSPSARVSSRRVTNNTAYQSAHRDAEGENNATLSQEAIRPSQRQVTYNYAAKTKQETTVLSHALPMVRGIQLVSPHELPDRFRQIFPYELFNAAQSKCFAYIYKTNDNVVVSAPTGSGKTALLELAICKLVEDHASGRFKIVYQAPTKSLCSERRRDWSKKFSYLNLSCAELTGDTTQAEWLKARSASIIVTTPEKWDSITRKWTDHHKLVQMVKLFLIDEVHILKDARGATLEAVVSRMKTVGGNVRFVALSATVPNSEDVATWLGRDHNNKDIPAHRETFSDDFRPVKLVKHVVGFDGTINDFAFEKVLDGKLPALIQKYTHKKPIMVFGFTRKSCEATARILAEWWSRQRNVDRAWPAPLQRIVVGNKELQELIGCAVAFHHAGLELQDRHAVEKGFLEGNINVICCTSTLAVGVNLPCHMVVLKGTVGFQDGGVLAEYSDLEVMQMLGRAGRPQFDDNAVAIIMTRTNKVERYNKMISGQDILESTLHLNLIEHLNSEISLGTIKNLYLAKTWLSETFLSVRMKRNPKYYKIDGVDSQQNVDQLIEQICERDIKLLQENRLITGDNTEQDFRCTAYGEAMSRYMVQFETMKLLLSIPRKAKTEQIASVFASCTRT
jgi:ATP-dependent DNA helicase HFM1/MER3